MDENFIGNLSDLIHATTANETDNLQQNMATSLTNAMLWDKGEVTFISSIMLAALFILWSAVSMTVIICLVKAKIKIGHELKVVSETVISSMNTLDTSENVAYGMHVFTS